MYQNFLQIAVVNVRLIELNLLLLRDEDLSVKIAAALTTEA
jgi:hypothetical protein